MKCIVPIQNFKIEEIMELGDAILVPAHVYSYTKEYRKFHEEELSNEAFYFNYYKLHKAYC